MLINLDLSVCVRRKLKNVQKGLVYSQLLIEQLAIYRGGQKQCQYKQPFALNGNRNLISTVSTIELVAAEQIGLTSPRSPSHTG